MEQMSNSRELSMVNTSALVSKRLVTLVMNLFRIYGGIFAWEPMTKLDFNIVMIFSLFLRI